MTTRSGGGMTKKVKMPGVFFFVPGDACGIEILDERNIESYMEEQPMDSWTNYPKVMVLDFLFRQ